MNDKYWLEVKGDSGSLYLFSDTLNLLYGISGVNLLICSSLLNQKSPVSTGFLDGSFAIIMLLN